MTIEDQVQWRSQRLGATEDADFVGGYDSSRGMLLKLAPHADDLLPDYAPLTVMSATGGFYVMHLYMGDLRRLLALQPGRRHE